MYPNRPTSGASSSARNAQIAAIHGEYARELQRRVARRAHADPQTIEDACSQAWLQLLTHRSVDLGPPDCGVLGWLTQTATREAWRLAARQLRDGLLDPATIDGERRLRGPLGAGADELADQHARLDLVAQIPQRPRRFLLRLALGYSYRDIAAHEDASMTTTNKQIARAKRLLRALDTPQEPAPRGSARPGDSAAARRVAQAPAA
jgi:DNA-directed RNA polymerase specialized sigma24 family protein